MGGADLHMHTVASDGTDTVDERAADAAEKELDAIAVTDHDTISGELSGRYAELHGVEAITGAEIKCAVDGTKVEVLGYFLDPDGDGLQKLFDDIRERRVDRMQRFVDNLNHHYDEIDLSMADVQEQADGSLGRPHLADALVDIGAVETQEEAFQTYISKQSDAYVPTEKVDAAQVIETVHGNGGFASLSHPGRSLEHDEADAVVAKLVEAGLDGIEVDYTYAVKQDAGSFTIHFDETYAAELAERYDLLPTGGSDCHGSASDKYHLGDVRVPYETVTTMKQHLGLD